MSHDKELATIKNVIGKSRHWPGRTEAINWWPGEIPSQEDFENAYKNLDKINWKVDYVLTHTCPISQQLLFCGQGRVIDHTETMLQNLWDKGL